MPKVKRVTRLTEKSFVKKIKNSDIWLIKFYSPKCGPCRRLKPEFNKVAKKLKNKKQYIRCGRINCLSDKKLAKRFRIKYYPCVKVILPKQRKIVTFKGVNDDEKIYEFALRMLKRYSKEN